MSYWYRSGTVDVENGSKSIVGSDTLWSTQASAGDLFTLDGNQFYEIETVTDDTHIELKTNFLGSTAEEQSYAIIRNFTSTLSAFLAARLADLLNRWHTREDEWSAWHNGTVDGGPESDGRYPFTDADGTEVLIACPAKMALLNGYTYIAYASDASGTDFTLTFDADLDYIAILRVAEEIETPEASDFAGLWFNYKGAQGDPGDSAYCYIAYASDASGTDFTLTFDADLDYIAILATDTEIPSPVVGDFAGLWFNYKGPQGDAGDSAYCYIAYASDASGTDFTLTFDADLDYIAILATDTEIPSPVVGDFAGLWFNYKGAQGDPGDSAYCYIAYASDASGTDFTLTFDADLDYIAILSTDTEIPSPVVGDFAGLWKNYKGAQGNTGPAPVLAGTSTTSITIENGSKVFTTQSGMELSEGQYVIVSSSADPSNYMHGQIYSYSGTTLTVTVTNIGGSGAHTDWNIALSGPKGIDGEGSGDVVGPAANTDNYIPQWNGADSKILKNGLPVPAGGLAGLTALGGKMDAVTATAENDFILAGPSPFSWVKKTPAQVKEILGLLLTQTAESVGFTLSGGTTPKTLTVTGDATISETPANLGANTFTDDQILSDHALIRAMTKDCGLAVYDAGTISSGTYNFDYSSGSVQTWTNGGAHTIGVTNWPPTGNLGQLLLIGTNLGAYTLTMPTVNWIKPDGTLTTTWSTYLAANTGRTALQASGTDMILLWTRDAGTTIYGKLV